MGVAVMGAVRAYLKCVRWGNKDVAALVAATAVAGTASVEVFRFLRYVQ